MFVKNTWYVAAPSQECSNKPLARTILNEPVVLYRTASGQAVALEDRCPHRYAPLSLGDVEADGLRCRYHGLKFNELGKCIEIPGQEKIPPELCLKRFPLVEKHHFLWIWMGDPSKADESLIVDLHWNQAPDWPTASGYFHYKANYQLIADNLLDFSHLTFVHRSTLANAAFPNFRPEITPFERGIYLNREIRNCEPSPLHQMAGKFTGKVDFWTRQAWWLPSIFANWAGSVQTGGEGPAHEREGGFQLRHFSLLTPETEKTTHYHWIQPCQFPHNDPDMIEKVGKGINTAFEEDRQIIQVQQEVINRSGGFAPKMVRSDAALSRVRMMLDKMIQDETHQAAQAGA